MRKFNTTKELTVENILKVSLKCEYEICTEEFENGTGLQDAGCLEAFLENAGVIFLGTDSNHYYYKLEQFEFKVPYEIINVEYDKHEDSYLLFDSLEIL